MLYLRKWYQRSLYDILEHLPLAPRPFKKVMLVLLHAAGSDILGGTR
jgi:hypothetical protein